MDGPGSEAGAGDGRALEGRHALVTGGGTGIGFGIARRLAQAGATVTIAGRREDVLEAAALRLRAEAAGREVRTIGCDVTDETQAERAVAVAADASGQLDIAVANAGSGVPGPFLLLDAAAWRYCCELNIVGTANTLRLAALRMRERGGSLVAISTAAAAAPEICMANYTATKAAVDMMVRGAAVELGPYGIRVNSIQPGFVPTEAAAGIFPPELQEELIADTPLGRAGTPEDIGDMVVHLCGPRSAWVTGQVIAVDGGLVNRPVADLTSLAKMLHGADAVEAALHPAPRARG